ncbi:MAG: serine kinase [Pseudomonadota bacterium]
MDAGDPFALRPAGAGTYHIHATCVAIDGKALLIAGPSGSGKSSLAIEMLALGAELVADDITELSHTTGIIARAPATLPRAIEARGLGLLPLSLLPQARVVAALDMSRCAAARLPPMQTIPLLGQTLPLLHRPASGPLAAALMLYVKGAEL